VSKTLRYDGQDGIELWDGRKMANGQTLSVDDADSANVNARAATIFEELP
jgi:hypothetical protein